jgi:hypothetical protein
VTAVNPAFKPVGASGVAIAPLVVGGNVFGWTADRDASFEIGRAHV